MNYKYGNKAQWRRHVWNCVRDMKSSRSDYVLYLAGDNAHDIEIAKRKGFDVRKMIAIERDPEVLKNLREKKVLTIDGDFFATLKAWPFDRAVGVVVADLCCGLTESVLLGLDEAMVHPAMMNATFVVNMLRGRDPMGAELARVLTADDEYSCIGQTSDIRHRGRALIATFMLASGMKNDDDIDRQARRELRLEKMSPCYYSYKSTAGSQVFDTVIYKGMYHSIINPANRGALEDEFRQRCVDQAQRRKVSATLAHCTRRMNPV